MPEEEYGIVELMDKQEGQLLVLVLIGILVLAGVAGGAYFLGKSSKSEPVKVTSQTQPPPQPTSVPQVSPTPDVSSVPTDTAETVNWLTFTSTKHTYSIKYPTSWKKEMPSVTENDPTQELVSFVSDTKFSDSLDGGPYSVFISFYNNPQHKNFKDLVIEHDKLSSPLIDNFSYTEDLLNGKKVYKTQSMPSQFGVDSTFFQDKDGNFISVIFNPYRTDKPFQNQNSEHHIYDQILSTFRFTQ